MEDTAHINKQRFYLIKDYVVGFIYVVDEKCANILFGGTNDEKILNLDYLTTMGLEQNVLYHKNDRDGVLVVQDSNSNKAQANTKKLKQAIMSYYVELSQGIDPQTREKTTDEILNATTVRIVGIAKNLDQAIKTYEHIKTKEKEKNIPEMTEKERVFIRYPHSRLPKNFVGKIIENSKTTREFI